MIRMKISLTVLAKMGIRDFTEVYSGDLLVFGSSWYWDGR